MSGSALHSRPSRGRAALALPVIVLAGACVAGWALRRVDARNAAAQERLGAETAANLEAELARERARALELEEQVRALETELGVVQNERLEREMNFLDFTSAVATLDAEGPAGKFARELLSDEPGRSAEPTEPAPVDLESAALAQRSAAMQRSLQALLRVEWVHGLDIVEIGLLDDGWIGPVVFRLLDDRGRLSGSLYAERLRLEGSATGRVVTLVLEEGHETHEGVSVPFKDGVRRILLPGVDPAPFHESLPELFPEESEPLDLDDGTWDLGHLATTLNQLLEEDATGEVFRLRHVGGVRDGVLRDVHVAVRDRDGATQRHLFADTLRIVALEKGVQLLLENGLTVRGDERAPFLDGRYRIFLPRARREVWEAAELPGLSQRKPAEEPGPSGEPKDAAAAEPAAEQ